LYLVKCKNKKKEYKIWKQKKMSQCLSR
jgi:hypothetical protein